MSFVRNMLIIKHVHHLSTDMEGKKYTIILNAYIFLYTKYLFP